MWGLANLCTAFISGVVRAAANATKVLTYGLGAQLLLFIKLLMAFTMRLDSLFEGLLWRLVINHTLYMVCLLLLYMLCPSLLKLIFQGKEYLSLLLVEGLRALLTPCFGELPPVFYSAIKIAIDLLSGATWLDFIFQQALSASD